MGRVSTEATIENMEDLWAVKRGLLADDQARRTTVTDALVDSRRSGAVAVNPTSGAVTISLPRSYRSVAGDQTQELLLGPKQAAILLLPGSQANGWTN